jgi:REP element-mobilizing transposase RayT
VSEAARSQFRMPREPRHIRPGKTYHLISRFVDREWFIKTAAERRCYLKLLSNAIEDSDWRLIAYAVMSNHIHLGTVAGDKPLDDWVRNAHAPFADFMNRKYKRSGPMFARGPKDYAVASHDVRRVIAYIHNNPVRAGVCSSAAKSNWTSHGAYIGRAVEPPWLHVSEGLARAGFSDARDFDAFVNDPARALDVTFSEECYAARLDAARSAARTARSSARRQKASAIVTTTAHILGLTSEQLRSTSRRAPEVLGRSVAVQCAMAAGLSGCTIAEALDLSQQRVSLLGRQGLSGEVRRLCAKVSLEVNVKV